jgi:RluA family pseudouridine synthase
MKKKFEQAKVIPDHIIRLIKNSIVYEDLNYFVINKPQGLSVHGGTKNKIGVISVMRHLFSGSIDLCHRIDKNTSGCLVLSKNKTSNKHFNEELKKKTIKKKYLAILKGHLKSNMQIDIPIDKSFNTNAKSFISDNGKQSLSNFKILKKLNSSCLVEVRIYTGRTHQIRLHMSHLGFPLIGDEVYGNKLSKKINFDRQALHSSFLKFNNPFDKKDVICFSELPNDIMIFLSKFGFKRDENFCNFFI